MTMRRVGGMSEDTRAHWVRAIEAAAATIIMRFGIFRESPVHVVATITAPAYSNLSFAEACTASARSTERLNDISFLLWRLDQAGGDDMGAITFPLLV